VITINVRILTAKSLEVANMSGIGECTITARAVRKELPSNSRGSRRFGAAQTEGIQVRKTRGNNFEERNVDAGKRCQGQRFQAEGEKPVQDAFCAGVLRLRVHRD